MMKKFAGMAALTVMAVSAPASAGTFIGDTFEGTYRFPNERRITINDGLATVAPFAQFTFPTGRINPTAQIFASSIVITFAGDGRYVVSDFNGIYLRNLSKSIIAGLTLNPASTVAGFDQSRLIFTNNTLQFNFEGLRFRAGDQVSADVLFQGSPVPEPSAWMVMILGFGGIGFALRVANRRRKFAIASRELRAPLGVL
jgi:hypothetical protein